MTRKPNKKRKEASAQDVCLGWEDFSIVKKVLKLSNHLPTAPNQWPNIQHRNVFRGI